MLVVEGISSFKNGPLMMIRIILSSYLMKISFLRVWGVASPNANTQYFWGKLKEEYKMIERAT